MASLNIHKPPKPNEAGFLQNIREINITRRFNMIT